jgi:thiamine monophosphate kinase
VNIVLETIPVAPDVKVFAREQGLVADELALFGGEEYELVVAIKSGRFASVRKRIPTLRRIGDVRTGSGEVITRFGGQVGKLEPRGYEHFS